MFKNNKTIDLDFQSMMMKAKSLFCDENQDTNKYSQSIVLKPIKGEDKGYCVSCSSLDDLINQSCSAVKQENISAVLKLVCMWKGNILDVPSERFLKTLCTINAENKKAEVLLNAGPNAYVTKKIADIIR